MTFRNQNGNFCPTWGYYLDNGDQKTMWTNTEKAMPLISSTTLVTDASATDGVYKLAYVINEQRLDLFINNTWVFGFDHAGYDYGTTSKKDYTTWEGFVDSSIKADSQIIMWAQNAEAFVDNVKISIPTDGVGVVTDGDTKTLSARTTTYEEDFTYEAVTDKTYDVMIPTPSTSVFGNTIKATVDAGAEALNVKGGEWKAHWLSLVGADKVNADNGVMIFDMNLAINAHGTMNISVNNTALASNHDDINAGLKANGFVAQFYTATETGYEVRYQYSTGSALTAGTAVGVELDKTNINLRVVANGNKYSIYIDGNFVASYEYDAAAEGKAVNENTNIILWAQSPADISIKDINIYTAK